MSLRYIFIDIISVYRYNIIMEEWTMIINELLKDKNMSRYKLSKTSGVPQTTITDICSGKTSIEKCSAETLYKIAKTLNISMESLLEE